MQFDGTWTLHVRLGPSICHMKCMWDGEKISVWPFPKGGGVVDLANWDPMGSSWTPINAYMYMELILALRAVQM